MTKKIVSALFIAIAMQSIGFAQIYTISKDSLKKDKVRKNEISLNLIPLFSDFEAENVHSLLSLTYRRNLNERWSIRVSPSITHFYALNLNNYNFGYRENIDSSMLMKSSYTHQSPIYKLNFGAEYNFGKRKLKWYAGADLFIGYSEYKYNSSLWHGVIETSSSTAIYTWVPVPPSQADSDPMQLHAQLFLFGFSPFVGIKYPLSDRITLSMNTGFDMYLERDINHYPSKTDNLYYMTFFEKNHLLNDVSLRYIF